MTLANNAHGYLYAKFGGVFSVFTIPGATTATATGVNDTGQVSGFYTDAAAVTHGFFLNQGNFTILNFPGATATQAFGLNNWDRWSAITRIMRVRSMDSSRPMGPGYKGRLMSRPDPARL